MRIPRITVTCRHGDPWELIAPEPAGRRRVGIWLCSRSSNDPVVLTPRALRQTKGVAVIESVHMDALRGYIGEMLSWLFRIAVRSGSPHLLVIRLGADECVVARSTPAGNRPDVALVLAVDIGWGA